MYVCPSVYVTVDLAWKMVGKEWQRRFWGLKVKNGVGFKVKRSVFSVYVLTLERNQKMCDTNISLRTFCACLCLCQLRNRTQIAKNKNKTRKNTTLVLVCLPVCLCTCLCLFISVIENKRKTSHIPHRSNSVSLSLEKKWIMGGNISMHLKCLHFRQLGKEKKRGKQYR